MTKREKRACKACEEQGVRCAPLPPRIIEKSLASDRVVIDGGKQIRRSSPTLSSERHPGARDRSGDLSGDFGWLSMGRRNAPAYHKGDGYGVAERYLYPRADETPVAVQFGTVCGKDQSYERIGERNKRAELRMKASSEPTCIRAAIMGASRPKKAKAIPSVSTAIVPQKLNMITR